VGSGGDGAPACTFHLNTRPKHPADSSAQRAALRKQLDQLGRAQTNLIKQLEAYEPTGDDDLDTEWTAALQRRFAQITAQRRSVTTRLAELDKQDHDQAGGNAALLDRWPAKLGSAFICR
jgi:hypothetical protein